MVIAYQLVDLSFLSRESLFPSSSSFLLDWFVPSSEKLVSHRYYACATVLESSSSSSSQLSKHEKFLPGKKCVCSYHTIYSNIRNETQRKVSSHKTHADVQSLDTKIMIATLVLIIRYSGRTDSLGMKFHRSPKRRGVLQQVWDQV